MCMANEPSHIGSGSKQAPFKFLLTSMFANVLLTKANHMVKSRVKVGRTTKLQGKVCNLARPLTGTISTAGLSQPFIPKVFSSAALLYLPPSWSCWRSCLSDSHSLSSRALCCLGSHLPVGRQADSHTLILPRETFLGLCWRHCLLRTSLLLAQSQKQCSIKGLQLESPKPIGIYQRAFAFKFLLPMGTCQEEAG